MAPRTLVFWGAGATAQLGMRTTDHHSRAIRVLADTGDDSEPLERRVAKVLDAPGAERWHGPLQALLTILSDTDTAYYSIHTISQLELATMRDNWISGADEEELRRRIIELRLIYDWPALKSVARVCPGSDSDAFRINDLFNILDLHIPLRFGFRAPARRGGEPTGVPDAEPPGSPLFFDARRLIGARNALFLVLSALFHIDYQVCLATNGATLEQYRDLALEVARRARERGLAMAGADQPLDAPAFYEAEVGFVSLNYDPLALWTQFVAHRELNYSSAVPHVGSPATPLRLYHDLGHMIPARGIAGREASSPWYPLNAAVAQRLNEPGYPSGYRVRLTRFLFPHGCLCWRECPDCGKLSAFHGHDWRLAAPELFPPPPLRAFDPSPCPSTAPAAERRARERGSVDARACLHCGTLTYSHHAPMVMQSSFKTQPPSFIDEIQRELRATTMAADHIVFLGYSLPPDDVAYRAFFSARRQRQVGMRESAVRCTIVTRDDRYPGWHGPENLRTHADRGDLVQASIDLFGVDNVRVCGDGVPNVFLNGGRIARACVDHVLDWPA